MRKIRAGKGGDMGTCPPHFCASEPALANKGTSPTSGLGPSVSRFLPRGVAAPLVGISGGGIALGEPGSAGVCSSLHGGQSGLERVLSEPCPLITAGIPEYGRVGGVPV